MEPGVKPSKATGGTGAEPGRWRELEGAGGWWSALAGGGALPGRELVQLLPFEVAHLDP